MKLLDQLKNIQNLLLEVSVKQLKKQNPDWENLIDGLINKGVDNKYLQWSVIMAKKHRNNTIEQYIDLLSDLANKFEKFSKSGKFKKAVKMKLIGQKQTDIQFWHKEDLDDFEEFISEMEKYNLESRREIKAADSDLVYKDDRVVMYSPETHRASCILGSNTKWCIAGEGDYFDDYTSQGKRFVFVIDRVMDPEEYPLAKIAMVYDIFKKNLDEMYDAEDDTVGYIEVIEHYDKKYWDKLKKEADSYIRSKKLNIKRADNDVWYGDRVGYGEWHIADIRSGYGFIPDEWKSFRKFLSDLYNDFMGEVVDPMRVNTEEDGDAQVTVRWEVPDRKEDLDSELEDLLKDLIVDEPDEPEGEMPEELDRDEFDSDEEYDEAHEEWDKEYDEWYDARKEWRKKYDKWENDQDEVEELYDAYNDIKKIIDDGDYNNYEYVHSLEIIDFNYDLEDAVRKFRG